MLARWRLGCFVLAVVLPVVACGRGSAAPNLSPVSPVSFGPVSSGPVSSASGSPAVPAGYPADVPLTGHNVRPGERPPVYPAAARARSQDGANAFAEFFMQTLDWAYATTNPSYMKHYYGPTCGQCSGLATGIGKTAATSHWYEGGRLKIHEASPTGIAPVTAPADFCSLVPVDVSATSVVDQTGKIYNGDGAHSNLRFKLCASYSDDRWLTTYLARL